MKKNRFKTSAAAVLIFVMVVSCIIVAPAQDAPASWARDAVINSLFHEIAYSAFIGEYSKPVTREEFAMIAVNVYRIATGIEPAKPASYTFNDIASSPYRDEIQIAKELGIVQGTNAAQTTFEPSRSVTRQEICVMILRVIKVIDPGHGYENIKQNSFTDRAQIASWAIEAVDFAFNESIMQGTSTTSLVISPLNDTTREQALTLVYRMTDKWRYTVPVSQRLLGEMNLATRTIAINNTDYLEDYLRDSLLYRKRDIRIVLGQGLARADIEAKIDMISAEFKALGYFHVPEIESYTIQFASPVYSVLVRYKNSELRFPDPAVKAVNNWEEFDRWLLMQVRTGLAEAAYDISDTSMRSSSQLLGTIKKLLYEHPELNYVKSYALVSTPGNASRYMVRLTYAYSDAETKNVINQSLKFADDFIYDNLRPGMSAIDKEIAVNDFIVRNTAYHTGPELPAYVYYENGVFFNKTAVCQGYASAAKLLLNKAGIYVIGIYGTGSGQPHAWNLIKLYGEYYHLDVTWNDPVPDGENEVRYDYFNITQNEILKTHSIEDSSLYPVAGGTRYNYFAYTNNLFSSNETVLSFIKAKITNGEKELTFKVTYPSTAAEIASIVRTAHTELGIGGYEFVLSPNEKLGVYKIYIK